MDLSTTIAWGITPDQKQKLLARIGEIVDSPNTHPAIIVSAFRAMVEASRVDQRAYEIEIALRARAGPGVIDVVNDDDLRDGLHRLMLPAPEESDSPGDERRSDREAVAGTVEIHEVA